MSEPVACTDRGHPVCSPIMGCDRCMGRCYEGFPGHLFLAERPSETDKCECGEYTWEVYQLESKRV